MGVEWCRNEAVEFDAMLYMRSMVCESMLSFRVSLGRMPLSNYPVLMPLRIS